MGAMDSFTTEAFTLLGIGLCFIFLRTYARLTKTGVAGFKADDYLMLVAAVVYAAETALAYTVGAYWHGLANNGMTDAERAALSPDSPEYHLRVNGSKTQVAGWSTYTLLLWLLKASMCTFYLRLTDGLNYQRRIYIGFGLIVATWLAVLMSILLGCRHFTQNWQINPNPGNYCQPAISRIDVFVTVVLNVLTDIYLLSIPLPMLWKANLRPAKKAGLMVLFSGGIFVTMAGILRCVLIVTNPVTGAQQAGSWACRETFVAVITSNIPMVYPLLHRWARPIFSSIRGLSSRSRSRTDGHGLGGSGGLGASGRSANGMFVLEDKNPRRGMGPRSVHPIPNMTFSESEEYIYDERMAQQRKDLESADPSAGPTTPTKGAGVVTTVTTVATKTATATTTTTVPASAPSKHRHFPQRSASSTKRPIPQEQASLTMNMGTATMTGDGAAPHMPGISGASTEPSAGIRAGITKQVVLQITEEERQRRRSDCASDESGSIDMLEAIQGARQGNYFLTQQDAQPRRTAGAGVSGGTGTGPSPYEPSASATTASPLAKDGWDGSDPATAAIGDSAKRGSLGLKSGGRRR